MMAEQNDKRESDEERDAPSQSSERDRPDQREPLDLEPVKSEPRADDAPDAPHASSSSDSDKQADRTGVPLEERHTCPNCNAIMPDDEALVCLRCGFDLKTLNVQRTRIEKPVEDDADDEDEDEDTDEVGTETPICRLGRGDLWVPAVIGGLSAALLIAGYLAGAPGLYPELRAAEDAVRDAGVFERMLGLLRFVIIAALLTGCGISGLWMLTMALTRPLGDFTLAAVRIGAIVLVMRLVTFINFGEQRQLEFMLESVLQAGLFVGLSIVAFAIKPRTALMLGGFALMTFLAVWIMARLVVLATW